MALAGSGAAPKGRRAMERTDPDTIGDELTLLSQFLDYHRAPWCRRSAASTVNSWVPG